MYLSVLRPKMLNMETASAFIQDEQQMHKLLTGLFNSQRKEINLLYKKILTEKEAAVLLQSDIPPSESSLFDIQTVDASDRLNKIQNHQMFHFRLITSPYVRKEGKRKLLPNTKERISWLQRKGEQYGFELYQCREGKKIVRHLNHSKECGGKALISGYEYEGRIRITDKDQFIDAYRKGIGPEKAYGFGLLMLSREGGF